MIFIFVKKKDSILLNLFLIYTKYFTLEQQIFAQLKNYVISNFFTLQFVQKGEST